MAIRGKLRIRPFDKGLRHQDGIDARGETDDSSLELSRTFIAPEGEVEHDLIDHRFGDRRKIRGRRIAEVIEIEIGARHDDRYLRIAGCKGPFLRFDIDEVIGYGFKEEIRSDINTVTLDNQLSVYTILCSREGSKLHHEGLLSEFFYLFGFECRFRSGDSIESRNGFGKNHEVRPHKAGFIGEDRLYIAV